MVIQDMLRVFIVRIACQKTDTAVTLLRPTMSWIQDHVSKSAHLSDTDVFKVTFDACLCYILVCFVGFNVFFISSIQVHRVLDFVSSLLEHPKAKVGLCFFYFICYPRFDNMNEPIPFIPLP